MKRLALAVLSLALAAAAPPEKLGVLIVTGSHRHDWVNTTPVLKKLLEDSGRFSVTVTEDPAKDLTAENLAKVQVVLIHYRENDKPSTFKLVDAQGKETGEKREVPNRAGRWPEAAEKALLGAIEKGTGCVVIHYATSAFDEGAASWPEFEKLIGGGWRRSKGFGAHGNMFQFKVKITEREHPITKGLPESFLHSKDELYHKSMMVEGNTVLFTGFDDPRLGGDKCTGKDEALGWVRSHGQGRVFTTVLGHGPDQMRLSPGFQALVARGAEWAATGKVTLPVPAAIDAPEIK